MEELKSSGQHLTYARAYMSLCDSYPTALEQSMAK